MNSKIVVGVGNIYATEALFAARIHPLTPAKQLHPAQIKKLCTTIQKILSKAIAQGGTTLKDFLKSDGKPGYFKQQLLAYGRTGLPCRRCRTKLQELRLAQRSSVFCPNCQQTVTWNQPPLYNRHRPP
jgi:formamidopyrimidine-DNA glycosylase